VSNFKIISAHGCATLEKTKDLVNHIQAFHEQEKDKKPLDQLTNVILIFKIMCIRRVECIV
jgi:hypothetical protein